MVAVFVPVTAAAASLSATWSHWRFSRPITLPTQLNSRFVSVEIPDDVYPSAEADLADLRVVDDQGRETPYILRQSAFQPETQVRTSNVIERSYSPGQYSQIVVDLGEKPLVHDCAKISISENNFFVWVEVAVSDDARDWRIIKDRAPIFRFRSEGREGTQTINYPDSVARYLRLRFFDRKLDVHLAGVEVLVETAPAAKYVPSGTLLERMKGQKETVWHTTLPASGVPVTQIRFETAQGEFDRSVTVETKGANDADWSPAGSGVIYRFARGGRQAEKLDVNVSPYPRGRELRVSIADGDDAPLEGVQAHLMETPAVLSFEPQPQRSYALLYGNSEAHAPDYDVVRTVDTKELASAGDASLGASEVNANYSDARPWTEQHPILMWSALIVAAAVLGGLALLALRSSSGPAANS